MDVLGETRREDKRLVGGVRRGDVRQRLERTDSDSRLDGRSLCHRGRIRTLDFLQPGGHMEVDRECSVAWSGEWRSIKSLNLNSRSSFENLFDLSSLFCRNMIMII